MNINYIDQFGILILLGIWAMLGYKYMKYWQQVKKALEEDQNAKVSLHSQEELNEAARKDFKLGYKMIALNTAGGAQILFSLKTDNPKVSVPLNRMRRVLVSFCITPFIFAIVLTFITALAQ
jgi:hypothetical protein